MSNVLSNRVGLVSSSARVPASRCQPRKASHVCAAHPVQEAPAPEAAAQGGLYFVAQNNFRVQEQYCSDFEDVWRKRESFLKESPGFIRFAMLRGDDTGEYISTTTWASRDDFMNWTKSQQFQKAHGGAQGDSKGQAQTQKKLKVSDMLEGPPKPRMYQAVTITEQSVF